MFEKVFSQSQQFMAGWGKLWQDQLERVDCATEDAVKLQEQGAARATQAIDELATLGKVSLQYANRMSAEWRRASMEAWRRGVDLITPEAPAAANPAATSKEA